jgi:hypothetical protein
VHPYASVSTAPPSPGIASPWPPAGPVHQLEPGPGTPGGVEPGGRRRWPKVLAIALAALLLGLGVGAGATYLATTPSRDRARDQRDAAQSQRDDAQAQLTKAQEDLTVVQAQVAGAKSITESCKRLVNDSKDMVDQWSKMNAIFQDPANQDVAPGSSREAELNQQLDDIASAIDHDQGLIEVDVDVCVTSATTL